MLEKNEIIKGLKNKEFIVRNAIYEHICNLHLYDDEDINKAFIKFLQKNYNSGINYAGLMWSKLNKEIIECLIQIHCNEKDEIIKEKIEFTLVNHYELIKGLNYNFEKFFQNEDDLLLYKKIKHFSNKKPNELLELYINKFEQVCLDDDETYISNLLKGAMEIALIQTEEGKNIFLLYVLYLMGFKELNKKAFKDVLNDNNLAEFKITYLPYLISPLCRIGNFECAGIVLLYYFTGNNSLEYINECEYYFSNICNEKFLADYIKWLKNVGNANLPDYFYDIAEFLNSDEINDFLLEKINKIKDKEVIANLIRILASKFDDRIIEIALNKMEIDKFYGESEDLCAVLAPLLIIEKRNDETSKKIIQKAKDFFEEEND